jgi:hypothetical protein
MQAQLGGVAAVAQQQQQQQQRDALPVEPSMLAQVLGAELSVLKDTAAALSKQLQRFGSVADRLIGADHQQQQVEFTFRPGPVPQGPDGSISIDGDVQPANAQHHQQQQLGDTAAGLPVGKASAAPAAAAAAAVDGALLVSAAVLQELQAAAAQQQRRCGKWKARCKQLAQQLSLLTAQWGAAATAQQVTAAAAAAASDQDQQQQGLAASNNISAPQAGAVQPEQHTTASPAEPAAAAAAVDLASLVSRLDAFETHLSTRLQRSLGASGALLSRAEGLAADAAAVAGSLEGHVGPLLGSAAALEAQVGVRVMLILKCGVVGWSFLSFSAAPICSCILQCSLMHA